MGKRKDYKAVLKVLSEGSGKSDEFLAILKSELPPGPEWTTSGGKAFWTNLAESNGWKLQQNTIMKNVRIIDNKNVKRVFSLNPDRLFRVMDKLVRELHEPDESMVSSLWNDSMVDGLATLKMLSQLHDEGTITDEEFGKKKKEILKRM